jgi:hypothetical protein
MRLSTFCGLRRDQEQEVLAATMVFTSLKGQWCKIFGLTFLHRTLPLGGSKTALNKFEF